MNNKKLISFKTLEDFSDHLKTIGGDFPTANKEGYSVGYSVIDLEEGGKWVVRLITSSTENYLIIEKVNGQYLNINSFNYIRDVAKPLEEELELFKMEFPETSEVIEKIYYAS